MSTDAIKYGTNRMKLGVDGFRPTSAVVSDGCCPAPLCVPLCDTACSFIDLLPSGPMWDRRKADARVKLQQGGDHNPCEPLAGCDDDDFCASMVDYGVYGARLLHDAVSNIIWPSVRENRPETAVTTIDDWLERLGWEDCYRQHCRPVYLAELSPYEFDAGCGPEYCPTNYSSEFECALKHATLRALVRAQRGIIKNLDGFNWIIEPFGVTIAPRMPYPLDVVNFLQNSCDSTEDAPPCFCTDVELEICPSTDIIPACPDINAPCGMTAGTVSAIQQYTCGDKNLTIYPALINAECLVRSMLPRKCPNIVFRCPGAVVDNNG